MPIKTDSEQGTNKIALFMVFSPQRGVVDCRIAQKNSLGLR